MKSLLQQVDIHLRRVTPEAGSPYPGIALSRVVRLYDVIFYTIVIVLVTLVAGEVKLLDGLEREILDDIHVVLLDGNVLIYLLRQHSCADVRGVELVGHKKLYPLITKEVVQIDDIEIALVCGLLDYGDYLRLDNLVLIARQEAMYGREENNLRM